MIDLRSVVTTKGKYVTVVYRPLYETVAKMVIQHYDDPRFEKTVFSINVLTNCDAENIDFRIEYPGDKYIYYQLDHLAFHPECLAPEYINQFDEIWDFGIENILWCYPEELVEKAHFMPLRYVDIPKIEPKKDYKYDLGFIGTLTQFRFDNLYNITQYWTNNSCRLLTINGLPYSELYNEVSDCKYILNLPRGNESGWIQNQVRITEAICSGKNVISYNLGGAADVYNWLINPVGNFLDILEEVKKDPVDRSSTYKEWTDTDNSYEEYRKAIMMPSRYKPRLI